jgi:uncharacterized protein
MAEAYDGAVIDCCIHHRWASQTELTEYMPSGWQEFLGKPNSLPGGVGAIPAIPGFPFRNPHGDKVAEAYPAGVTVAGSDYETLRTCVLERARVERAVLAYDDGIFAAAVPNQYLALEICRAANDWCVDRWLSGRDSRLYGLILVPNATPHEAAAEIRRAGRNDRMVGVLMGGNGGGKVFGHSYYHPIYEAALELDLPVVVHVGGDAPADATTLTVAAGLPLTFSEYSVLSATPLMSHLVSFIVQGVFEKYPGLRVLIAGAGTAWLPAVFWRLDTNWKAHRREVPWVRRLPSEYLRESVRLTTWPLDRTPRPGQLVAALGAFGGAEELLCYASGWPDWNSDSVEQVAAVLPAAWHERVFHANAGKLFRWDRSVAVHPKAHIAVGTMVATGRADIELVSEDGVAVGPDERGSWSDD